MVIIKKIGGKKEKWKISVLSAEFFCIPNSTLNKVYFLNDGTVLSKKSILQTVHLIKQILDILTEILLSLLNKFVNLSFHKNIS